MYPRTPFLEELEDLVWTVLLALATALLSVCSLNADPAVARTADTRPSYFQRSLFLKTLSSHVDRGDFDMFCMKWNKWKKQLRSPVEN